MTYYNSLDSFLVSEDFVNKLMSQSSVECLLRDKQIVLLGDPGSGKTYESINVLKQICTNTIFESYIPIYMKLMEYGIVRHSINFVIKCFGSKIQNCFTSATDLS